jgi:hypothetical protein
MAAVIDCDINPQTLTCTRCGKPAPSADIRRNCQGKPGLGDVVALWLEWLGITPARVERIAGRPCGCARRKAWLNEKFPG